MALLFTILLGLSSGVLGYFAYYFNRGHFVLAEEDIIDTELRYLAWADGMNKLNTALVDVGKEKDRVYLLLNASGERIGGSLSVIPQRLSVLQEGIVLFSSAGRTYASKVYTFPDGRRLLAGIDVTEASDSYRILQYLSFASILLMTAVVAVSFIISTFVVSRTNKIASTAQKIIETGDLSRRIPVSGNWDDLSNSTDILNMLLARIEHLMFGIKQVSDNIAHDLRTPLTRVLNNLETLKRHKTLDEKAQSLCDAMIAETGKLLETFNALLRITRIESGKQKQNFTSVDLQLIVMDVAELYEPVAKEKSIRLIVKTIPIPTIQGDRNLLFQCCANVLDNAIKFTPRDGTVSLNLFYEQNAVHLNVYDTGPGIDKTDKAKVFERFYRAESSRTTEGNGLGLSMVAAVVKLHNGFIALADPDLGKGLIVKLSFPD